MSLTFPVTLSPAAIAHFKQTLQTKSEYLGIRLAVKKSGCSKLSYDIDFAHTLKEHDITFKVEDITLAIDPHSLPYLQGMHIDCVQEGLDAYIKFINPNVTGECGCGESFTTE